MFKYWKKFVFMIPYIYSEDSSLGLSVSFLPFLTHHIEVLKIHSHCITLRSVIIKKLTV